MKPPMRMGKPETNATAKPPESMQGEQLFFECYDSAPDTMKDHFVALLVGRLYRESAPDIRARLIDHLVRPLGILSLMAVANGVFSRLRLRSENGSAPGAVEAVQAIQGSDVVTLVDFVQQVSVDCVDSLQTLLSSEAGALTTAAAVVLLTILRQRAQARRSRDRRSAG